MWQVLRSRRQVDLSTRPEMLGYSPRLPHTELTVANLTAYSRWGRGQGPGPRGLARCTTLHHPPDLTRLHTPRGQTERSPG